MDNEQYADFIQYYRERSEDGNSFKALWQLNKEYEAADAHLASQSGMRIQEPALKMDSVSKTKTFDVSGSKNALREEYKNKADEAARSHGFTGLSYDEHIKQKERQDNKEPRQNPQQETISPKPTDGQATEKPLTDREKQKQEFKRKLEQIQENNKTLGKQHDR